MAIRHCCLPDHDLMLRLTLGKHTAEQAIEFIQSLDETCATRWLSYFHPTADMSKIDLAHLPAIRRAMSEKRRELFGDKPKAYAIVCGCEAAEQYFDFCSRYSGQGRAFTSLDEAYDWLGLSEADRAVASHTLQQWAAEAEVGDMSAGRSRAARSTDEAPAEPLANPVW